MAVGSYSSLDYKSQTSLLSGAITVPNISRARLPLVSDDLSFWSDLFTWRQIVLERIINTGNCSHKFTQERVCFNSMDLLLLNHASY